MSDFIAHAIAIHIVLYKHTYTHTEELIQIKFNVNVVFPSNITSVVIKVFHSKNNKYKTSIKKQKPSLFLYFGPRGMVRGGRRERGSGWGTCAYLWWIHFDVWQNQYNIVK